MLCEIVLQSFIFNNFCFRPPISFKNARLKAADIDFINELALYKDVRSLHMVPHYFVAPFKGTTQAKIAVTRVDVVDRLLKDLGVDKHR